MGVRAVPFSVTHGAGLSLAAPSVVAAGSVGGASDAAPAAAPPDCDHREPSRTIVAGRHQGGAVSFGPSWWRPSRPSVSPGPSSEPSSPASPIQRAGEPRPTDASRRLRTRAAPRPGSPDAIHHSRLSFQSPPCVEPVCGQGTPHRPGCSCRSCANTERRPSHRKRSLQVTLYYYYIFVDNTVCILILSTGNTFRNDEVPIWPHQALLKKYE